MLHLTKRFAIAVMIAIFILIAGMPSAFAHNCVSQELVEDVKQTLLNFHTMGAEGEWDSIIPYHSFDSECQIKGCEEQDDTCARNVGKIIKELLDSGVSPHQKDNSDNSFLFYAVRLKSLSGVKILLERGVDPNVAGGGGYFGWNDQYRLGESYDFSPIHWAISNGPVEIVRALMDAGADISRFGSPEEIDFMLAVHAQNIEEIRKYLEQGISPDTWADYGTPLHYFVWKNNPEIAKILIEAGADLQSHDQYGNTPLHSAVSNDAVDIVRLLVDAGADVNALDHKGGSVLQDAELKENDEIIRILEEAGATE